MLTLRSAGLNRIAPLVLVATLACDSGPATTMVLLAPPLAWREALDERRRERDEFFRTSSESPLPPADLPGFRGLAYWPPDERYYFAGSLQRYPSPERFDIVTTAGKTRPCERFGWISLPLDGEVRVLQVYRLLDRELGPGPESLFLPFRDETSGRETYGAGRYVDLEGRPEGPYVVDFNAAYHPSCAYGDPERFACPVTPAENRLPLRIEAGERNRDGALPQRE